MLKLKKLRNGYYFETLSGMIIEKNSNDWIVKNECDGSVYFNGSTLKSCKNYIKQENEILSL